jgi:hypothetical protein
MGGLTREEVKDVQDKIPLLGDIPLIGRLFRSKGHSTQKRNLLIFVTAKLVDSQAGNGWGGEIVRMEPPTSPPIPKKVGCSHGGH